MVPHGDGGTIDDEGHLTISDRTKDVIITGGENVSSIEVEDCISHLAEVAEVAVIGVPDEQWGETIKALVVRTPGTEIGEKDVIAHCKQRLAGFKAPTTVEFRDAIPRTATGKVQGAPPQPGHVTVEHPVAANHANAGSVDSRNKSGPKDRMPHSATLGMSSSVHSATRRARPDQG